MKMSAAETKVSALRNSVETDLTSDLLHRRFFKTAPQPPDQPEHGGGSGVSGFRFLITKQKGVESAENGLIERGIERTF